MKLLSIIIVSFNTKQLLKQTINSFYTELNNNYELIVVDNNSSDGSAKMIQNQFPKAQLIQNKKNLGFAKANNQGISHSNSEYILLLNSDTIVKPNLFKNTLKFLKKNPKVGIVSPKLLNKDGSIQPNGGALPNLRNIKAWMLFLDDVPIINRFFSHYHQENEDFFKKTQSTGWVAGTAMFIRRKTIQETGLLDEKIFMYSEDNRTMPPGLPEKMESCYIC